ncbi:MAG TPA: hypothetical protein VFL83_06915 [Anaeromyxobacter sp.]|nr:hypothetical protein [Anaeromyxobacter sp.]
MATERIGDILVEMKACTPQELQAALQTQAIFGGRIGTNLLELGIIDEQQLAAALTKTYGIQCLAGEIVPTLDAIAAVPAPLVERLGFVPLEVDDRRMRVVVADPRDLAKLDEVAFATGKKIEPVLASEARVWTLMHRFYGIDKGLRGLDVADELEGAASDGGGQVGAASVPGDQPGLGPRLLSHREALDLIDQISDPVVLSALLVRGAGGRAGRAVFLKCQGQRAVAWLAAGPLLANDVRGTEIPLEHETPFGAAAELRAPVLTPIRPAPTTARFLDALGGAPPMNAFVGAVILRGRAVALLYADAGPGGTLHEEAADLITLTAALNRRFEALAPVSSAQG